MGHLGLPIDFLEEALASRPSVIDPSTVEDIGGGDSSEQGDGGLGL